MNILIVDPHSTMRHILKNLLKQMGARTIDEADNGKDALNMMHKKNYQMVIAEWTMPVTSGLDMLKMMRSTENFKAVPFVMMSADQNTDHVLAAKEAGVTDYILKPFNQDTLQQKLNFIVNHMI